MREMTEFHEYNPFFGITPLMLAAVDGHTQVVTMLLEKGADVTASTNTGKTALDWAEQQGHSDTATILRVHSEADCSWEGPLWEVPLTACFKLLDLSFWRGKVFLNCFVLLQYKC
uniref:Uncharacterized protein n=1 Tax=Amphimedon queenslandica TaxID=400682 RepID=A0A1X7TCA3_AMPQE